MLDGITAPGPQFLAKALMHDTYEEKHALVIAVSGYNPCSSTTVDIVFDLDHLPYLSLYPVDEFLNCDVINLELPTYRQPSASWRWFCGLYNDPILGLIPLNERSVRYKLLELSAGGYMFWDSERLALLDSET